MKYQNFVDSVVEFAAKSGENVTVKFENDIEAGKFIGLVSNGVRFFANSSSLKITVRWGNGHQAQFNPTHNEE